jgi:large subunit ribosomal protein L28e
VKRRTGGGAQFSRDPLNLLNKNSRKHAGFVNDKAVGLQAGPKGEITLSSKNSDNKHKPAESTSKTTFGKSKGSRK